MIYKSWLCAVSGTAGKGRSKAYNYSVTTLTKVSAILKGQNHFSAGFSDKLPRFLR